MKIASAVLQQLQEQIKNPSLEKKQQSSGGHGDKIAI